MLNYIKLYIATLIAFFAIDMVWLGVIAKDFYRNYIGFIMAPDPNWIAAILFYLLFIFGTVVFVVLPGLKQGTLKSTLIHAALFGFITYATFDLTNQAVLKDWPVIVTIIDLIWGAVLCSSVSFVSFKVGIRLKMTHG